MGRAVHEHWPVLPCVEGDMPMMEKFMRVSAHSAYSACSRCSLHGEYIAGAVRCVSSSCHMLGSTGDCLQIGRLTLSACLHAYEARVLFWFRTMYHACT